MSKIIFDCGISLDGFFAGDNRSPDNPMGGVSPKIHQWMFKQKAFWYSKLELEGFCVNKLEDCLGSVSLSMHLN